MANPFPFTAGQVLTAAQLNGIGEWLFYTPTLTASVTNPTLGTSGVQSGSYARIQNLIVARFIIIFGTSGVAAGSGNYRVSLPVPAAIYGSFYGAVSGKTSFYDSSANNTYFSSSWVENTNYVSITYQTAFNGAMSNVSAASPVIPAANDVISGLVIYQAA